MDAITNLLLKLGLHNTYLGFRYLYRILALCLEDENNLLCITRLYEIVGKEYNTAANNIESCVRTAIAACWIRGNQKYLKEIAMYDLKLRPTASEFLDILYFHLKSQE